MESQEDFQTKTEANLFSIESRPSTLADLLSAAAVLRRRFCQFYVTFSF